MKKKKYWALCCSLTGMLIFLVAFFLIYDYGPPREQADSTIDNMVQTHQQDDMKIAHSEVIAIESGEYLHCTAGKEAGTFRYTKKKIKLTGQEKTTCQHGRTGYIDARCQYAIDVSGCCDLCGLQQNDIREELWWGEWACERVDGNEEK